ncbi:magnesium transporter CorA family protein [Tessaracoccus sp.]|nr:hypothetical protein [Tessaracoccus sp.]
MLPNGLITVRTGAFDFDEVLQRWADEAQLEQGVGALVHGMLDTVVDGHFDAIQALDDEALEDMLFGDRVRPRAFQQRVFAVPQGSGAVAPQGAADAGGRLCRDQVRTSGDAAGLRELDGDFDDLYDHVIRAADWSESPEVVGNAFETSLSLQDARFERHHEEARGLGGHHRGPDGCHGLVRPEPPYPGYASGSGLLLSIVLIVAGVAGLYLLFRRVDWL